MYTLYGGEKWCPDFCFLPLTGKAGVGAAGNHLEMQTFTVTYHLNDNGYSLLSHILQNQGSLTVLRMTSVFMACNWKAFEFLQNTMFYVTSKKSIPLLNTPSLKSVPFSQESCWVMRCYLGTEEHGLVKGVRSHFSDHVLFMKMDWRVINQMPF